MSRQPIDIIEAAGIEKKIYNKHPVIFNSLNLKLLQNFLYICKAKTARGFFLDDGKSQKKYFYYTTNKKTRL